MARAPRSEPLDLVRSRLQEILGGEVRQVAGREAARGADLLLQGGGITFAVEWKAVGDAANVGSAVRQLAEARRGKGRLKKFVPVVAVPYMGQTGRAICAEAGLSWLDLSGNAWIDAPGRQIHVLGQPNRFLKAGRPANVFAPKSARVVRALLMAPAQAFSQADLAVASGVDKGRVSRLVRRLATMGLVEAREDRLVRLKDPSLALEAWREAYDFETHAVRRGHVAVRGPEELLARLAEASGGQGTAWALTGLAAAWQLTRFAMYRLTTVFLREQPSAEWLRKVGFRDEPRGANVWFVRPVDDAVFEGSAVIDGVPCVHPIQVYLDLKAEPERSQEAADELKKRLLTWSAA